MIIKKTHNLYSIKYNQKNQVVKFGKFGIKVVSFGRLTKEQISSLERFITFFIKNNINNGKEIKIWNLVNFNLTLTKLSSESRMGKGKGAVYTKAIFLKPGVIIFEFNGVTQQQMLNLFNSIKKKVSFEISLISNFKL